MRKAKWNLTLPLPEARKNGELVALADSQIIRWLDELNGLDGIDEKAAALTTEIRRLRKEVNSSDARRRLSSLYDEREKLQFKPDYITVIMDTTKDYLRACKGFTINGITYHRLVGTNGGVKNETIVFISDRHGTEIRRRIENGRNMAKEMVPAKLEAYKALSCSASTPVSMPNGVIVVNDCETNFMSDVIYLDDECDGEPLLEYRSGTSVELNESDGYGIMLPSLAERWAKDLGIDYVPSGVNTRYAWEKGMVFTFDFIEFADRVAGSYEVTDAWGTKHDIRDIELILTTSMVKLWDSYETCDDYIQNSTQNGYAFGVTKVCPKTLEHEHALNYQFIQSYNLSNEDIRELIEPTINELKDILGGDWRKTILFMKGKGIDTNNIGFHYDANAITAIMVDPRMVNDPFIQDIVYKTIKKKIDRAKIGVINVHGNYSMVSGDPYSLCQSIFGLDVTGLLRAGEIYNGYWNDYESERLACFRAPMSCHNNIRLVRPNRSDDAKHWYQHMSTVTVFNSWDTAAHALNGCDKDGDLVMLTDNRVLVDNLRELPALMCVQRKAQKKLVTEDDAVAANIASFGDAIGQITNRITSMFEVQSRYDPDSDEYKELEYRIMCGQLYQQNAIST